MKSRKSGYSWKQITSSSILPLPGRKDLQFFGSDTLLFNSVFPRENGSAALFEAWYTQVHSKKCTSKSAECRRTFIFLPTSDCGSSENFGLNMSISNFFDWMFRILQFATRHFKSYLRQVSFFDNILNLWGRPYSLIEAVTIGWLFYRDLVKSVHSFEMA